MGKRILACLLIAVMVLTSADFTVFATAMSETEVAVETSEQETEQENVAESSSVAQTKQEEVAESSSFVQAEQEEAVESSSPVQIEQEEATESSNPVQTEQEEAVESNSSVQAEQEKPDLTESENTQEEGETEGVVTETIHTEEASEEETLGVEETSVEETGDEAGESTECESAEETTTEVILPEESIMTDEVLVTATELSGKCGDNLTWTLVDGTLTISGTGAMWDYTYDHEFGGGLNTPWKDYLSEIECLVLENGIASIADYAFYGCSNATGELKIPDSVTSIGEYAFFQCRGFTGELKISENVRKIGYRAFWECSGFTGDLMIPKGITIVNACVFEGCSGFTGDLIIPNNITYIGYTAFDRCSGLTGNIYIPDSVLVVSDFGTIGDAGITIYGVPGTDAERYANEEDISFVEYEFTNNTEKKCGNNLTWTLEDGILTISGTGDMWDYEYMMGNDTTCSTTAPWRNDISELKGLVLENGITRIGEHAFSDCRGFTGELNIPDSVTSIGKGAFYYCRGFTGDLKIPDGVTSIGRSAFSGCSGFTGELKISENVKKIGYSAFERCSGFTGDLIIPDSLTSIEQEVFSGCSGFNGELKIPDSVTSIGAAAFAYCKGFTGDLYIPDSVTDIEREAFRYCSGFDGDLHISNSVTTIEHMTFYDCSGFTGELKIPNSVTSIGSHAFDGCSGFTGELYIPDSVTSIEYRAFRDCDSLSGDLIIPNSVTYIETEVFWDIPNQIIYGVPGSYAEEYADSYGIPFMEYNASANAKGACGDKLKWTLVNGKLTITGTGVMYDYGYTNGSKVVPWRLYRSKLKSLILKKGMTSIGNHAFDGCRNLIGELIIPNSVTSIGKYAFDGCSSFTGELIIPNSVISIGEGTFSGCSGFIGDLTIPNSVTSIGIGAFESCSGLSGKIVIPESVTDIGADAFKGILNATIYGMKGSYAETYAKENNIPFLPYTFGEIVTGKCGDNLTWILDNGTLTISGTGVMWDYEATNGISTAPWGEYTDELRTLILSEGITHIGNYAFYNCKGLKGDLKLPESVTSIGDYAFYNCTGFTGELTTLENITNIGAYAFYNCICLIGKLVFSDSITSIGDYAFYNCKGLNGKIYIPAKVASIGEQTFYNVPKPVIYGKQGSYAQTYAKKKGMSFVDFYITEEIVRENIEINGRGKAYSNFILMDENGEVMPNKKVYYTFNGVTMYNTTSDNTGKVVIETPTLTNTTGSVENQDHVATLYYDAGKGKKTELDYKLVMKINVKPLSFAQSWELAAEGSLTGELSAGGKVNLGVAKMKASLAEASITGSLGGTMSVSNEYDAGVRKLTLVQSYSPKVAANAEAGLAAEAAVLGKDFEIDVLTSGAGVQASGQIGTGLCIENYDPSDMEDLNKVGKFLFATQAQARGNVLLLKVAELMGFDYCNVVEMGTNISVEAGANVGSVEFNDNVELGALASAKLSSEIGYSEKSNKSNGSTERTFSHALQSELNLAEVKLFNVGTSIFDASRGLDLELGTSKNSSSEIEGLSVKMSAEQSIGGLADKSRGNSLQITYADDELTKLIQESDVANKFVNGTANYIFGKAQDELFDDLNKTSAEGECSATITDSMTAGVEVGLGATLGVGLDVELAVEGVSACEYEQFRGVYTDGEATITSISDVADMVETNKVTLTELLTEPVVEIGKSIGDFLVHACESAKDGVSNGLASIGSKLEDAKNWLVHLVTLDKTKASSLTNQSYHITTYTLLGATSEEGVATTVGEPYILYVINEEDGNEIQDYSESPLELTLQYTDDLLTASGVDSSVEGNLAIYAYSEEYLGYVRMGGIVDTENNSVTITVTKPGQFILAIDTAAPVVTSFELSDATSMPDILVGFDEISGFSEFSMTLDGVECVNTESWRSYFDANLQKLVYPVPVKLENGQHTVTIYAVDEAGNAMAAPATYTFEIEENISEDGILPEDYPEGNVPDGLWIAGIDEDGYVYTGQSIKPEVRVYHGTTKLVAGKDYTISYKNNKNANDASVAKKAPTVTIKGKGNYTGSETATFKILPASLEAEGVVATEVTVAYNGKVQKKVPTVTYNGKKLTNKKDFIVSYPAIEEGVTDAFKAAGTYDIVVTAKEGGNFTGSIVVKQTITEAVLMSKVSVGKIANQTYTGSPIEPELKITYKKVPLVKGTDYTVTYLNNTEVGKASIVITGMGQYAGTKTVTFKITGQSLSKAKVTGIVSKVYDGAVKTQDIVVTLKDKTLVENVDYEVIYAKNQNAGKASVTIKGIGSYTGSVKKSFTISAYDLKADTDQKIGGLTESIQAKYVKGGCKPKLALTFAGTELVEGKDYTLSYANNKAVTTETTKKMPMITIKGKGNFKGSVKLNFVIVPKALDDAESPVVMTVADVAYVNKAGKYKSTPVLVDADGKKLTAGTDYDKNIVYTLENGTELTKKSKVPAETKVVVTVKGKGKYSGELTATYRITKSDFKKASIKISSQTYTGNAITLDKNDITVKIGKTTLVYGTDYEIVEDSYTNNVKKGTAKVTIVGKGNYGGTKTVSFKIAARKFSWFWRLFEL